MNQFNRLCRAADWQRCMASDPQPKSFAEYAYTEFQVEISARVSKCCQCNLSNPHNQLFLGEWLRSAAWFRWNNREDNVKFSQRSQWPSERTHIKSLISSTNTCRNLQVLAMSSFRPLKTSSGDSDPALLISCWHDISRRSPVCFFSLAPNSGFDSVKDLNEFI